jgi:hypothetical protein
MLKAKESANVLYKEYIDHFQKLNQLWIRYLWNPFLTQAQVKDTEKIQDREMRNTILILLCPWNYGR